MLIGEDHRLDAIAQAELDQDALDVRLDRRLRHVQGRRDPRWWRVAGYIGGASAMLSSAIFPYYLFAAYGVVVGVWALLAKTAPVTGPQREPVTAA
jgi:hypothetical protein